MAKRIQSIQSLRAIAFILIFISHTELLASGVPGVSLFLILSGFCMTYSYYNRKDALRKVGIVENIRFAAGKIKKLYPLHFLMLLAVATATAFLLLKEGFPGRETMLQGFYFCMNAALLQSWIPIRDGYFSYNAVSWYLSVTAFCYFIFPWLLRGIRRDGLRRNKNKIVYITGAMMVISAILGVGHICFNWDNAFLKWVTYICPLYRVGDFAIGASLGYCYIRSKRRGGRHRYTAFEIIGVIVLATQIAIYVICELPYNIMFSLFWLPACAAIVFLFGCERGGYQIY